TYSADCRTPVGGGCRDFHGGSERVTAICRAYPEGVHQRIPGSHPEPIGKSHVYHAFRIIGRGHFLALVIDDVQGSSGLDSGYRPHSLYSFCGNSWCDTSRSTPGQASVIGKTKESLL